MEDRDGEYSHDKLKMGFIRGRRVDQEVTLYYENTKSKKMKRITNPLARVGSLCLGARAGTARGF